MFSNRERIKERLRWVLVCAVAVISVWGAKRAAGEPVATGGPCTEACFVRHCAHG
jgi:hypothetical protein